MSKIGQVLSTAMTVGEMRRALEGKDDDMPLLFVCDYGDYSHTQQAIPLEEVMEIYSNGLYESGYSNSGIAMLDSDPDEDDGEELVPVLVLR